MALLLALCLLVWLISQVIKLKAEVEYLKIAKSVGDEGHFVMKRSNSTPEERNLTGATPVVPDVKDSMPEPLRRDFVPSFEYIPNRDPGVKDSMQEPLQRDFVPNFDWVAGRLARIEWKVGRKFSYEENCTKRLPHAIIIGVMKSGTEALTVFLAKHPDIAMQLKLQTVSFFNDHYMQGLDWYKNQMPCSSEGQITMEKSPQYFTPEMARERIHEMNSSIKLIIIVREPIKRAISHYTHLLDTKPGLYPNPFEKTITGPTGNIDGSHMIIARSLYWLQLNRWLEYLKMDQIHVVNGDNFKVNPVEELTKIETFLGLRHYFTEAFFTYNAEKGFYCLSQLSTGSRIGCMAHDKGRTYPVVQPYMMDRLKSFFKPYNEEFFRIIGQRFDWGY